MSNIYGTTFNPKFSDFDIQGVLNSKHYLDYLTEARIEQHETRYKIPMSKYLAKNQTFVVQDFHIKFNKPILFGHKFVVYTQVKDITGPIATMQFRFVSEDNEDRIYSEGTIQYSLFDFANKKSVSFSEEDKSVYLM